MICDDKGRKVNFLEQISLLCPGAGDLLPVETGEGRQGPGPDGDLKSLGFRLKPCLLWLLVCKILDVQTVHCDQHSTLLKSHQ